MGVGEDLAEVNKTVADILRKTDRDVKVVQLLSTYNPITDRKPQSNELVLANIGKACEVRNISVEKARALTGKYVAGDREMLIPGPFLSRELLSKENLQVLYGDEKLSIERWEPVKIRFEVVTQWRLVVRKLETKQ